MLNATKKNVKNVYLKSRNWSEEKKPEEQQVSLKNRKVGTPNFFELLNGD